MKINSYGSFPVTRPSTLTNFAEDEEDTKKGCFSTLYVKLMGRPRSDEQGDEGEEWHEQQLDPPSTWQEHCSQWLRVHEWTHDEKVVGGCVLALLFFSSGERIFFKAAVDDMAPFRCTQHTNTHTHSYSNLSIPSFSLSLYCFLHFPLSLHRYFCLCLIVLGKGDMRTLLLHAAEDAAKIVSDNTTSYNYLVLMFFYRAVLLIFIFFVAFVLFAMISLFKRFFVSQQYTTCTPHGGWNVLICCNKRP